MTPRERRQLEVALRELYRAVDLVESHGVFMDIETRYAYASAEKTREHNPLAWAIDKIEDIINRDDEHKSVEKEQKRRREEQKKIAKEEKSARGELRGKANPR